jgi:hypothetical protein
MKPKGGILRVQVSKHYKPFVRLPRAFGRVTRPIESCAEDVMTMNGAFVRHLLSSVRYFKIVTLCYNDLLISFTACLILQKTSSNCEYRCMVCIHHPSHFPGASDGTSSDGLSSLNALIEALNNLDAVCETVEKKYHGSLATNDYERWEETS